MKLTTVRKMNDAKRVTIIARVFAGLAAILGAYLIIDWVVIPFSRNFPPLSGIFDVIFLFVFPLPVLAFGCYCIFAAYRLWLNISPENIRRISLICALAFLVLVCGVIISNLENRILSHLVMPLSMITAGIFFLLFNNIFLRWLRIVHTTNWVKREKSTKTFFTWLALFSWTGLGQLFWELLPKEQTHSSIPEEPWGSVSMLVALLLAILIYKIGVVIALWNKPKQTHLSNNPIGNTTSTPSS